MSAEDGATLVTPEDDKNVPPPAPTVLKPAVPQVSIGEENHPPQTIPSDLSPVTEEPSSGTDQVKTFSS